RLAAFDGQLLELRAAAADELYNLECAGPSEDNDVIRARIENAVLFMKENYALDLTRDMVAESVYMSGAYFSRCFKQVTGITYKDYLIEIRMQKAVEFLKTNQKISEIALKVGYPNPNRFNINFRHYTSYTPSEYRTYVLKMI
ncbi:MAG: helix-turn-helix transcriptional regulator, partial [Lachnospiraceae bacterium]|nr:helix-turn-helix transcriptional regulator [Lachnospiraceae bacterium]